MGVVLMNVAYINPVIKACTDIFKEVANMEFTKGNLYMKQGMHLLNNVSVSIGVIGSVKGNFYMNISKATAIAIASAMMGGYEVTELDEMTTSAVSEFCNMIAGHAGMNFAGDNITIDITPPDITINRENSQRNYMNQAICVPLVLAGGGVIELDISLADVCK